MYFSENKVAIDNVCPVQRRAANLPGSHSTQALVLPVVYQNTSPPDISDLAAPCCPEVPIKCLSMMPQFMQWILKTDTLSGFGINGRVNLNLHSSRQCLLRFFIFDEAVFEPC